MSRRPEDILEILAILLVIVTVIQLVRWELHDRAVRKNQEEDK